MALDQLIHADDGTRDLPGADSDWYAWVSASKGRNFVKRQLLLDWLDAHGRRKGFVRDDRLPGYDPRLDFLQALFRKGNEFEAAVLRWLEERFDVVRVSTGWEDTQDRAAAERTFRELAAGREIVAQAVLWNPQRRTYGAADLLVRSDVLNRIVPDTLSDEEAAIRAPGLGGMSGPGGVPELGGVQELGGAPVHYRVVDVKYSTIELSPDGHLVGKPEYATQLWIYNEALGRLQGFTPPSAYLLARVTRPEGGERSASCLERLGRVDRDFILPDGVPLADLVAESCAWVRRVREEGREWEVLPEPSVPELMPVAGMEAGSWGTALGRITAELAPRERKPVTSPLVQPVRVRANEESWRTPAPAEFYVDFETTLDLNDDFSAFPEKGATPLIYMVGCGWLEDPLDAGGWRFRSFTTDRLTEEEEARILDEWVDFLQGFCAARGTTLDEARMFHWSSAEPVFLETQYNSPVRRHGRGDWAGLPWVDLLKQLFKAEPILVGGTAGYGLKEIAGALHAEGIIDTLWDDGPGGVDGGMAAMAGAWWADAEAAKTGGSMRDFDVMAAIERYNEIDCRVMAEILAWLRRER
jgi:predicted RecB family nuclease